MNLIHKAVEAKLASEGIDWVKLHAFKIDKDTKTASATVGLEGESDPVAVLVSYDLEPDYVQVRSVEATRPWIGKALSLALTKQGGKLPLPPGFEGSMVRMLL